MDKGQFIALGILIMIVGVPLILLNENEDKNKEYPKIEYTELPIEKDYYNNSNELHWDHMPLSYKFEDECIGGERRKNLIKEGFEAIANESNYFVYFEEIDEGVPDISITCGGYYPEITNGNLFSYKETLGDAIYEISSGSKIITKATINFYKQGQICSTGYPALEVHEILHIFDIPHNPLMSSVMNPYAAESSKKCKITKIDKEYISCLKFIYSNGEFGEECYFPNFIHEKEDEYVCEEDWYPTIGDDYCCPEPNMIIDWEGYCSY